MDINIPRPLLLHFKIDLLLKVLVRLRQMKNMARSKFDPEKDIPSLKDKVIFVTGGTAGLGESSIYYLAKAQPAHIYFTGRNTKSAETLINKLKSNFPTLKITFIKLDLSSLSSINTALTNLLSTGEMKRLDILLCCAGIMAVPPGLSKDNHEIQFATNHLGHASIIKHLFPTLLETSNLPGSDVRIVILTSAGWAGHPKSGIDFKTLDTTQESMIGHWIRYAQSKLANIIYARLLASKYPSIKSVSIHPGVVKTGLVSSLGFWDRSLVKVTNIGKMLDTKEGIKNQLYLATCMPRDEIINGGVYYPVGILFEGLSDVAKSERLAEELWDWTEKALGSGS